MGELIQFRKIEDFFYLKTFIVYRSFFHFILEKELLFVASKARNYKPLVYLYIIPTR